VIIRIWLWKSLSGSCSRCLAKTRSSDLSSGLCGFQLALHVLTSLCCKRYNTGTTGLHGGIALARLLREKIRILCRGGSNPNSLWNLHAAQACIVVTFRTFRSCQPGLFCTRRRNLVIIIRVECKFLLLPSHGLLLSSILCRVLVIGVAVVIIMLLLQMFLIHALF